MNINNTINKRNAAFLASFLMAGASVAIEATTPYEYKYALIQSASGKQDAKLAFSVASFPYGKAATDDLYMTLYKEVVNKDKTGDDIIKKLNYVTKKEEGFEAVEKVDGTDKAFKDDEADDKKNIKVAYFKAAEIFNYIAKKDADKSKAVKTAVTELNKKGEKDVETKLEEKFKAAYNANLEDADTQGKKKSEKVYSVLVYKGDKYKVHFFNNKKDTKIKTVIDEIAKKDDKVKTSKEVFYLKNDFTLKKIEGEDFEKIKTAADAIDDEFKAQGLLWGEFVNDDTKAPDVHAKIKAALDKDGAKIDELKAAVKAATKEGSSGNDDQDKGGNDKNWKPYIIGFSIAAVALVGIALGFMFIGGKDEETSSADKNNATTQENQEEGA